MTSSNQIEILDGVSLFEAETKYIVHQCNCVSKKAAHLAKDMFYQYPYADVYKNRTVEDTPGSIKIMGNGVDQRYVISMFAQYYPGKSKYATGSLDGIYARQLYFVRCLNQIRKIENLESIGFPYGIGCGAAGGNWNLYLQLIQMFADRVDAEVKIYKLII